VIKKGQIRKSQLNTYHLAEKILKISPVDPEITGLKLQESFLKNLKK